MSNRLSSSPSAPSRDAWAEVRSHDQVVRYRRSGAGRAVLLLRRGTARDAHPLWPELDEALSSGFRVIVPDAPPEGADVAAWLRDFLEGLGTVDVAVIAAGAYCMPALELALLGAGQVARVLLVPDGVAGEAPSDIDRAVARAGRDTVPILVVRRSVPADAALAAVARFLAGCTEGVHG